MHTKSKLALFFAPVLAAFTLFVLAAVPAWAGGCPNEVFRESEQHGVLLGDCRAYEQVSPAGNGKNGNDAKVFPGAVGASPSGSSVHYFSTAPFEGAELIGGETTVTYLSSRGLSGEWVTQSTEPTEPEFGGVIGLNEDLSQTLVEATGGKVLSPGAPLDHDNYYLRSASGSYQWLLSTDGDGRPQSTELALSGFSGDGRHLIFESVDGLEPGAAGGYLVANLYELNLEKPAGERLSLVGLVPGPGQESCSGEACVTPPQGSYAAAGGEIAYLKAAKHESNGGQRGDFYTQDAISRDGGLVFFTALPSEGVYVRVGEASTFAVSVGPARFLGATPDGEYAFYSEGGRLFPGGSTGENAEGETLYRYDTKTHEREAIVDEADTAGGTATGTGEIQHASTAILDVEPETGEFVAGQSIEGEGIPAGDWIREVKPGVIELWNQVEAASAEGVRLRATSPPGVLGVLGVSSDGSSVYFAAIGVLASNGNSFGEHAEDRAGSLRGRAGNVYEWHRSSSGAERITFVSRLDDNGVNSGGDELDWMDSAEKGRVTPDGSTLLFAHYGQLYRYAAGVEGGAGSLVCVSCKPSGPTTGVAELDGFNTGARGLTPRQLDILTRNLSENGDRVFFDTSTALLPEDRDEQTNVYEWEAPASGAEAEKGESSCTSSSPGFVSGEDGCLFLISTGSSPEGSYFGDASADGSDVFFFTDQQLAASDADSNFDVYDARVDAEGPQHPPCVKGATYNHVTGQCEENPCYTAEDCKEPPSEPPAKSFPATAAFTGPGNLTSSAPPIEKPRVKTKTAAQLRAEKLARALKACKRDRSARKRTSCERTARKRYGPTEKAKRRGK